MFLTDQAMLEIAKSRQRAMQQQAEFNRLRMQIEEHRRSESASAVTARRMLARCTVPAVMTVAALCLVLMVLAYMSAI